MSFLYGSSTRSSTHLLHALDVFISFVRRFRGASSSTREVVKTVDSGHVRPQGIGTPRGVVARFYEFERITPKENQQSGYACVNKIHGALNDRPDIKVESSPEDVLCHTQSHRVVNPEAAGDGND